MPLKLKEACKSKVVGFAGRSLPLFLRKPEDIEKLALIAQESKDRSLLALFEEIPTEEELRAEKVSRELPELPVSKIKKSGKRNKNGR